MSEDPQSSIKVIDRRRSSASSESSDPSEGQSDSASKKEDLSSLAGEQVVKSAATSDHRPSASSPEGSQVEDDAGVDFASFVVSFYTQALVMLGEIPNPESGVVATNLSAARQTIEILVMIEEKTSGNLSADEKRLLSEVVANLQLAYVNKVKSASVNLR